MYKDIEIPETEIWDPVTSEFHTVKKTKIRLMHSLVSVSKWESKWMKEFLSKEAHTDEQTLDYIRCMTVTQNVDPMVYTVISGDAVLMQEIADYINSPMTATTIHEDPNAPKNRQKITSELIYYWMIQYNIPQEYQKWHLNRLITLIRVCSNMNTPPKKLTSKDYAARAKLNEARLRSHHLL